MPNEPTIGDVLEAISSFATSVDQRFDTVDQRFDTMELSFDRKLENLEERFDQKLNLLKSDLTTEIDRFVVLHQTLDVELVALRSRCERMENFMSKVAKRLDLEYSMT